MSSASASAKPAKLRSSWQAEAVTITYGDQAENHVGMQKLGKLADEGFSVEELERIHRTLESKGVTSELYTLQCNDEPLETECEPACVLVIRGGVKHLADVDPDQMLRECSALEWDTKAKMYGRVVSKHARYNLCFADKAQEPDYAKGMGRVVPFGDVPCLSKLRESLAATFGAKAAQLQAEGNLYYDASKCGIGYHGDAERRIVIAARLGASIPLHYTWFYRRQPRGETVSLRLNHGDVYIMSEKATGFDWKKSAIPTLRHAAGADKFLKIQGRPIKRTFDESNAI